MANTNPTVAEYLVRRIARLGVTHAFGVPGDYSFPIDNAIESCPGLDWVLCANELNAAYAADGYARKRGIALLATTYGVGELSALNGVMGARAHRLPVFHLVGAPSLRIQKSRLITHHTLGDGRFSHFETISASAACVCAKLTADNAIDEIERVIREALRLSAPAYILLPQDQALMPVIGVPVQGEPLANVKRHASSPDELEAAAATVLQRLNAAKNPIALPTSTVTRYGLNRICGAFLTQSRIRFATTPMDKGVLSEGHPGYIGIYNGANSSPAIVSRCVEEADLVLDIGGVVLEDINTGFWTDRLDAERLITLGDNYVAVGGALFTSVTLSDMLKALEAAAPAYTNSANPVDKALMPMVGDPEDRISSAAFYPRLQRMLHAGDILVAETGTCTLYLPTLLLPDGVGYQSQTLWGSIGWATPATLGLGIAAPEQRIVLVTGDGSHQFTANELGTMGRYGIKPIIFVLNNGLYGIEEVIGEKGHVYDELARWNYRTIPEAMGCKDWFTVCVSTVKQLENTLSVIQSSRKACYVEVLMPPEESQPLPEAVIEQLYKAKAPHP